MSKLKRHDTKGLARVVWDPAETQPYLDCFFQLEDHECFDGVLLHYDHLRNLHTGVELVFDPKYFYQSYLRDLAPSKSQGMTKCGAARQRFKRPEWRSDEFAST